MFNIALEGLRAVVLSGLVVVLWRAGRKRSWPAHQGWRASVGGFGLLLFGSLLDITDDIPALGRFLVIGDTRLEAFLEVFVGYLGGALLLAMGLLGWPRRDRPAAGDSAPKGSRDKTQHETRGQGPAVEPQPAKTYPPADVTHGASKEQVAGKRDDYIRAVVEHAPCSMVFKDVEGRYRYVNKHFEAWYGVSAADARGRTAGQVLPQQCVEACIAQDREALDSGCVVSREQAVLFPDGTDRLIQTAKFPVFDSKGRPVGVGGIGIDLTDSKEGEAALLVAKAEAEVASRAKSEFLANMSHQLRAPLDAIIGFSELIENETLGPVGIAAYRDYAQEISASGRQLLKHINDMLDLSRIEAGKLELCEEDIDVAEAIRSALLLAGGRAHQGGVVLEQDTPEDLPRLRADERMLKQILADLLSNAVRFTPAGGTVRAGARLGRSDVFVLWVSDTGIGMGLENIPKAMVRPGRIGSAVERKFEGTGLGLPLTKSLVELHGGMLDLDSELGVGTTVTIRFPAARVVHPLKAATSQECEAAG